MASGANFSIVSKRAVTVTLVQEVYIPQRYVEPVVVDEGHDWVSDAFPRLPLAAVLSRQAA